MRNIKFYLAAIILVTIVSTVLPACQKGDDDPIISVVSRKDRFTNTWTLKSFEKNGVTQDLSGTTYIYNMFNDGTLTQTVEGSIFRIPYTFSKQWYLVVFE